MVENKAEFIPFCIREIKTEWVKGGGAGFVGLRTDLKRCPSGKAGSKKAVREETSLELLLNDIRLIESCFDVTETAGVLAVRFQ